MRFRNLSKTFRYENSDGKSIAFLPENGFLINKPVGIDTVNVSLSQAQGINQVGVTVQSKNVQPRPVSISGILIGDSQAENKDLLMSIIRPDLSGRLYADDYYIECSVTSTPTIGPQELFAAFQFSLLAPYPYWSNDQSTGVELTSVNPLFRLWDGDDSHTAPDGSFGVWDISGEYAFGELIESQFFTVNNTGQLPVPFTAIITARGPVTNPKITDVESGRYLLLNYSMSAGERVTVEITHERTYVTSSINGDIRGALAMKSTFNRLSVGESILKPEAASGGANMEIALTFANEVVGIAV